MVREPAAVLSRPAIALAALGLFDLLAPHGPDLGTWAQVVLLGVVSLPLATVAVRELLPWRAYGTRLLGGAAVAAAVAAACILLGFPGTPAMLAKLVAASLIGYALATLIGSPVEVVAIALLIAAVDIYSVAAGPTEVIVEEHENVLNALTLAFHPVGSDGAAQIGVSDFIFFAVFLAAAAGMRLRVALTWTAMTASFGLTLALSYGFDTALPALPLLSLGFLAANADLLLRRRRGIAGSP